MKFIGKKLSNDFGEDKIRCIKFSKTKIAKEINLSFTHHRIKQYDKVE